MAFKNLVEINNPLVKDFLTKIRDKKTLFEGFRENVEKLSVLLACEAAKELSLEKSRVNTPLAPFNGSRVCDDIVLMPVLRAGLGLMSGFTQLYPNARVGHIGVYRDEKTLKPVRYYFKFPRVKSVKNSVVFILDPMLATGGSIVYSIDELKKLGVKKIVIVSMVSAPEGIAAVNKHHKGLKIYTCALDKKLNNK